MTSSDPFPCPSAAEYIPHPNATFAHDTYYVYCTKLSLVQLNKYTIYIYIYVCVCVCVCVCKGKGKVIPLQVRCGPEGG